MRKIYTLLAGLCLMLASNRISAQTITPDVANFTFQLNAGTMVSFTNTSVIGNVPGDRRAWWYFGDGNSVRTAALGNIQHSYANHGTYTVCLKIYRYFNNNDSVLTASECKTVTIAQSATCTADFQYLDSVITGPPVAHKVKFSAFGSNSQNRPIAYVCWNFGDGTPQLCIQASSTTPLTSLLQVQHIYNQTGPFTACVKIVYQEGCIAEKCRVLELHNPAPADSCRANFERINVTASTNPLQASFRALPWHNLNKKPTRICWQFGDGSPDTCITYPTTFTGGYTVNHIYPTMGTYQVCVKIRYDGGCESHKCESVIVHRPDSCSANYTRLPGTSINNLTVNLKALPWHNNGKKPSRICWSFGDGTRDTCINYLNIYTGLYTMQHTYANAGAFRTCVKINYYGGCESYKCDTVRVEQTTTTCGADFERIQSSATNPGLAYFRALLSNSSNRKPQRICWRFGDGTPDTCITYPENYTGQYVVSHNYNHAGQFEACVSILYYGGCEARKCKMITILPTPSTCSVSLSITSTSATGLTRTLFATPTTNPFTRPERVCWYFGDGTDTCIMIDPTQPVPNLTINHTYPGPGVYHPCVKIRYVGGCEAQSCRELAIHSGNTICGGFIRDSLTGPRTYDFKGFSIHSPGDHVTTYRWTFGDGITAFGQQVTHTYSLGGQYNVCLTIVTQLGCETRICKTIHVGGGLNIPTLVLTPNPVVSELHALFTSNHAETVNIKITNQFGVVVRTFTRVAVVGSNNWGFDVSTLTPGIYTFSIQSPNQLASAVFIKL